MAARTSIADNLETSHMITVSLNQWQAQDIGKLLKGLINREVTLCQ